MIEILCALLLLLWWCCCFGVVVFLHGRTSGMGWELLLLLKERLTKKLLLAQILIVKKAAQHKTYTLSSTFCNAMRSNRVCAVCECVAVCGCLAGVPVFTVDCLWGLFVLLLFSSPSPGRSPAPSSVNTNTLRRKVAATRLNILLTAGVSNISGLEEI